MIGAAAILETLELVAERHGDPTAAIYSELFALHPDLEPLFWMDRDGGVRAAMVQQALECILGRVEGSGTATNVFSAARQHHDGYGVSPERFDDFMPAVRDAFRNILGADWTETMEQAWRSLLAGFATTR